jgi:Tfp pilus assembly protein PilF
VLAVFAVVVTILDVVGWWGWHRTTRNIDTNPEGCAARVADDRLLALPKAVQSSRRLASGVLAGASTTTLAAALERIGGLQKAWFWNHPEGFRHASRAALIRGDFDQALEQLEHALTRDPTSAFLHRWAAMLMRASGRHERCLEHLADARAISPTGRGEMIELSERDEGWLRLEALRRRFDFYPRQRTATAIELSRELRRTGQTGEARAMLEALVGHPMVAIELARWDLDRGEPVSAVERLEVVAVRTAYPVSVRGAAWAMLAEARDLLGDARGAVAAARQAVTLDPESTAPYLALATIAERREDPAAALEHLRTAWGLAPTDVGLLVRVAGVAERADRPGDARRALERAVELEPSDPELAGQLVAFHLRHGQYMEAALLLSSSLDRFPTHDRLLELAGRLRREVDGPGG